MKQITIRIQVIRLFLVVLGLTQLQNDIFAQTGSGTKTTSVVVTNTPTVEARQSGPWTVALEGTPTFKIDPNNNTVRLDPSVRPVDFFGSLFDWTQGRFFAVTQSTQQYSRLKVCVQNEPTGQIRQDALVRVLSRNPTFGREWTFEIDRFTAPQLAGAACKVYDLPGGITTVSIEGELNTSGSVSVGLWGQPN